MVAAEAKRPRIYIKSAFKTMYARFALFFIGGALACGIVVAYSDPTLVGITSGTASGGGTASASPYVIAMQNLRINGLPHLVNALLCTSIFSAGNTYTYCATRSLYGMALEGRAPAFLRYCTKNGVPVYAFAVTMIFPCLSFLQVSNGSAKVLGWLINLVTAGGVITYIVMSTTYIFFHKACKEQGLDRKSLPYYGWGQPYCAYLGLAWMVMIVTCYGYSSLNPFDVESFFIYYAMLILGKLKTSQTYCVGILTIVSQHRLPSSDGSLSTRRSLSRLARLISSGNDQPSMRTRPPSSTHQMVSGAR